MILASASPRRRELLAQAGIAFSVLPAGIDETPVPGEAPDAYVLRIAHAKASAVGGAGDIVLAADTAVVVDGALLGKPADAADAARMLRTLSARTHDVLTAVAVRAGGRTHDALVAARVTFRDIDDDEIAAYCRTDEPWDKAGGYAVQGRAAAFVSAIDGSYTTVVGLPMFETLAILRAVGVTPWRA